MQRASWLAQNYNGSNSSVLAIGSNWAIVTSYTYTYPFKGRSRIFLYKQFFARHYSLPPRQPSVFARLARWQLSSFIEKKLKIDRTEIQISVKECTKPLLRDANYDRENNDSRTLSDVFNSAIFSQILWDILLQSRSTLSTCQVFFPSNALINYVSSYRNI